MLKEASMRRAAAQKKALSKAPVEKAQSANALLHKKQPVAEVTPTQLQLAKAAMLEAKTHAKAAGAAARRAKESYELAFDLPARWRSTRAVSRTTRCKGR